MHFFLVINFFNLSISSLQCELLNWVLRFSCYDSSWIRSVRSARKVMTVTNVSKEVCDQRSQLYYFTLNRSFSGHERKRALTYIWVLLPWWLSSTHQQKIIFRISLIVPLIVSVRNNSNSIISNSHKRLPQ